MEDGSITQGTEIKEEKTRHRRRHVTIRIQKQHKNEVVVRVKRDLRLGRVMLAYSERLGLEASSLRFILDGKRIREWQTPDGLGIEDGDTIDVWSDMTGGGGSASTTFASFPF